MASEPASSDFMIVDGDTLWMTEPVVILGSRVPVAMPGLVRDVAVMGDDELERLPVRSLAEALALLPEVEISQRQQYGTQADLSIRGSTYQQVQVLLDGFPIGDPQTAHHSLDLPLAAADVSRLEVLGGHGATLYGTGAFGGIVNVVSREPSTDAGGELVLGGGDFGARNARVLLQGGQRSLAGAETRTRVAADYFRTDGEYPGSDAENLTISGRSTLRGRAGEVDLLAGYARREFGALDFYAPYPSFERTETVFAALRSRHEPGRRIVFEPRLHFRRHVDHFVLLRESPEIYTNDHVNRSLGAEIRISADLGEALKLASGLEAGYEDIDSEGIRGGLGAEALGEHRRRRAAAGVEVSGFHDRWNWTAGARLEQRTNPESRLSRSAAIAWRPDAALTLRASTGTVFRAPSFTELYYVDPANAGDPDLAPEHGWAWDGGFDLRRGAGVLSCTYFERRESDLIDWVRPTADPDAVWQAANIGEATVRGWSQGFQLNDAQGRSLHLNHTRLEKDIGLPADRTSKYALNTFNRLWSLRLAIPLGPHWSVSPVLRYRDPLAEDSYLVGDLAIEASWDRAFSRLMVTNLGDRDYAEVPGVMMPGRVASLSSGWRF